MLGVARHGASRVHGREAWIVEDALGSWAAFRDVSVVGRRRERGRGRGG